MLANNYRQMVLKMQFRSSRSQKAVSKIIQSADTFSELFVSNSYLILLCRPFVLSLFNDEKNLFERALAFQAS